MSLVSSRVGLKHTVTIERDVNAGSPESWGNPSAPIWQPHLTDLPCRAWAAAGGEVVTDKTDVVVVEELRLVLPLGTDVTEHDRIASVSYRGGTIQDGPIGIRAKLTHADHIELVLVKVA